MLNLTHRSLALKFLHNCFSSREQPFRNPRTEKSVFTHIVDRGLKVKFENHEQRALVAQTHLMLFRYRIKQLFLEKRKGLCDCEKIAEKVSSAIVSVSAGDRRSCMKLLEATGSALATKDEITNLFTTEVPKLYEPYDQTSTRMESYPPLAHIGQGGANSLYIGSSPSPRLEWGSILIVYRPISRLGVETIQLAQYIKSYPFFEDLHPELKGFEIPQDEQERVEIRLIPGENMLSIHMNDGTELSKKEQSIPKNIDTRCILDDDWVIKLEKYKCFLK